jgi:hypothetical protein
VIVQRSSEVDQGVYPAMQPSSCSSIDESQLQGALAECCVLPLQRRQCSACVSQLRMRGLQVDWHLRSFLRHSAKFRLQTVRAVTLCDVLHAHAAFLMARLDWQHLTVRISHVIKDQSMPFGCE